MYVVGIAEMVIFIGEGPGPAPKRPETPLSDALWIAGFECKPSTAAGDMRRRVKRLSAEKQEINESKTAILQKVYDHIDTVERWRGGEHSHLDWGRAQAECK